MISEKIDIDKFIDDKCKAIMIAHMTFQVRRDEKKISEKNPGSFIKI